MAGSWILPNEGLPTLLQFWTSTSITGSSPWNLVLYTNSGYTPSQASVYSDLTIATFTGYTPVSLTFATWTTPTIVSNKAVTTWGSSPYIWTATAGFQTIYGAAMVTASAPKILAITQFTASVDLSVYPSLGVLPRLTFGTDPSPTLRHDLVTGKSRPKLLPRER